MIGKLKNMSENVALNASDSGEEVNDGRFFLKGGTATALCNNVSKCVEVECTHEQSNGSWNAVMLTGRINKVALITVHRMVHSQASEVNSSKAQYQRSIGKVESAKIIRKRQLKELAEYVNKCKAADVIVAGDFNESTRSENIKSFMNETEIYDVFTETNVVETDKKEATYQHGIKCVNHVLATDGTLRKVKECELTECSEIVESDHRGCLTDVDFAEYFSEEFVGDEERAESNLNPNRKST